jgi:hypothetical protein
MEFSFSFWDIQFNVFVRSLFLVLSCIFSPTLWCWCRRDQHSVQSTGNLACNNKAVTPYVNIWAWLITEYQSIWLKKRGLWKENPDSGTEYSVMGRTSERLTCSRQKCVIWLCNYFRISELTRGTCLLVPDWQIWAEMSLVSNRMCKYVRHFFVCCFVLNGCIWCL